MKLSTTERSVKLKIETKSKAPSDEGAGFLQSKKTEGEILIFLSFHRKRSPFLVRGRHKRAVAHKHNDLGLMCVIFKDKKFLLPLFRF